MNTKQIAADMDELSMELDRLARRAARLACQIDPRRKNPYEEPPWDSRLQNTDDDLGAGVLRPGR